MRGSDCNAKVTNAIGTAHDVALAMIVGDEVRQFALVARQNRGTFK